MIGFIQASSEQLITELLSRADIRINGKRPWDITVSNPAFFDRLASCGSLALGESYMDGWWDCPALDQFFFQLLRHRLHRHIRHNPSFLFLNLRARLMNRQNRNKAFVVGEKHYDTGNDLFELMLDDRMAYSCGYWRDADDLNKAQQVKLDLICKKLQLARGMRLLDIGCGWGSLARFAARNYGVEVIGITISNEQAQLASKRCAGLPVEIRLQDYREINETFDAVVSVGMFEHVGYKNYRAFMEVVHRNLEKNGLFLLHSIASNRTCRNCDPWFDKYIFPGGMLPSVKQIGAAIEKVFIMEDWHNIGVHYDKTLMAWYQNFVDHWKELKDKYSERFFRMWCYYLLSLAGGFRSRHLQVWQIVLSREGKIGGYDSLRCVSCPPLTSRSLTDSAIQFPAVRGNATGNQGNSSILMNRRKTDREKTT